MSILQYGFMQRAFLVGILLAVITPCIGITIVLKRMSMIGDALSHSSLAGVVLGLILGVNPVAGAVVMCIVAALGIEAIRKKIPRYSEVAISIVMSAGIGLAGVLSGFVENGASLNSFLFGSIVSISEGELALVVVISVLVLAAVLFFSLVFFVFRQICDLNAVSMALKAVIRGAEQPVMLPDELQLLEDDLTHLKEELVRREQEAALSEKKKNELVAYLAHDLKTPLTSVLAYLSMLDTQPEMPEEERIKYTHITMEKALRLEELLLEFFDITRFNLQDFVL